MGKRYCRKISEFYDVRLMVSPEAKKITDAMKSEDLIAMARAGRLFSKIKETAMTIGEYHTSDEYKEITWEIEEEIYRLGYIVPEGVYNPEHKFKEFLKESAYPYFDSSEIKNWYADFEKNWEKYFFSMRNIEYTGEINAYYQNYDFEGKRQQIFELLWGILPQSQYEIVVFSLLHEGEYDFTILEQQAYECAKRNVFRHFLKNGQIWDILDEQDLSSPIAPIL